jgi:hypothetical protein
MIQKIKIAEFYKSNEISYVYDSQLFLEIKEVCRVYVKKKADTWKVVHLKKL